MNFQITVLGSGAATPTFARHCAAQVLTIEGFRCLIDCGESTQNQMRFFHQKIQSIDTIFLSHLHGDHLFGLPGLLATMHLTGRTQPVDLYAPLGIRQALETLFAISGTHLQYELRYHEIDTAEPIEVLANTYCRVTAFPLRHSVPTYGYIFEECHRLRNIRKDFLLQHPMAPAECRLIKQGLDYTDADGRLYPNAEITVPPPPSRRYAYCCDTAYFPELVPILQGVDLLCIESTFGNEFAALAAEKLHLTAAQAATLARDAGVGQLLLTHISARYKEPEPLLLEAQQIFPNTAIAEDGAQYLLPPPRKI